MNTNKCETCGRPFGTRSKGSNSFYWVYLTEIEAETGNDKMLLHEIFKRKFLAPRFVMVLGKEYKLPATTTTLNPTEFSDYIRKIEVETGILAKNNY